MATTESSRSILWSLSRWRSLDHIPASVSAASIPVPRRNSQCCRGTRYLKYLLSLVYGALEAMKTPVRALSAVGPSRIQGFHSSFDADEASAGNVYYVDRSDNPKAF